MIVRRRFLVILLAGTAAACLLLRGIEWWLRPGPTYSRVEEGLYMGGQVSQPPPGTRVVLNLCEREDPYRCEIHRWEPIPDAAPAPDLDWLRRMVEFIDSKRREDATTYVHCKQGVSRAGLVVTAYEMFKNNWSRDEALAFVRLQRPQVRPNPAFMDLLAEWERRP
jgi:hypothetical protein